MLSRPCPPPPGTCASSPLAGFSPPLAQHIILLTVFVAVLLIRTLNPGRENVLARTPPLPALTMHTGTVPREAGGGQERRATQGRWTVGQ